MSKIAQLPDDAKIWIYQANRKLTSEDKAFIESKLPLFMNDWAAHGDKLNAFAEIISDYHIALSVVEDLAIASGCSIDASTRFVKMLEKSLEISFMDRFNMLIEIEGEFSYIHFSKLNTLPENAIVYNNSVSTVGAFKNHWKQSAKNFSFV